MDDGIYQILMAFKGEGIIYRVIIIGWQHGGFFLRGKMDMKVFCDVWPPVAFAFALDPG